MLCIKCGKEIGDYEYCPYCGEHQECSKADSDAADADDANNGIDPGTESAEDASGKPSANDAAEPKPNDDDKAHDPNPWASALVVAAEMQPSEDAATPERLTSNKKGPQQESSQTRETAGEWAMQAKQASSNSTKTRNSLKALLTTNIVIACLLLTILGVGMFAYATAYHWQKVDIPEKYSKTCSTKSVLAPMTDPDYVECLNTRELIPAVTHEAVCYLGFIGECPEDGEVGGSE